MFKLRPDLLPPTEEGMSKESQREMVRQQLKALLDSGISPLEFFAHDIKSYYYVGECLAMVDLSLTVKCGVQ